MLDKSIIDIEDALNRALGDVTFLKMMYDEFQEMVPQFLNTIQKAVEKKDTDSLDRTAHQMKGAAANLGILSISSAAFALEKIGKSGDPTAAPNAFENLKLSIDDFRNQLDQINWTALEE